jgi:basic membrane protein A
MRLVKFTHSLLFIFLVSTFTVACGSPATTIPTQPPTSIPTVLPSSTPQPTSTPEPTFTSTPTATEVPPTPTITSTLPPIVTEEDCPKPELLCIGLVTDLNKLMDHAFNQSTWESLEVVQEETQALVNYIETTDANDYLANIATFAEKEYDLVVTVGFSLGPATMEAARNYPATYFIGVDQYQSVTLPNLAGLIFHEDQAGFLAGALAAQMTKTGIITGIYGSNIEPVVAFHDGYLYGAQYINPDISVLSTYHPADDIAFNDPDWGAATASDAIEQGADVIFAAAGRTGHGALIETASYPGLFCIGSDIDQWETLVDAHACLISSAMKLPGEGVRELIQSFWQGNPASGNYYGPVGLAPFYAFENLIPQDVKDRLSEIITALRDGSLPTGYTAP